MTTGAWWRAPPPLPIFPAAHIVRSNFLWSCVWGPDCLPIDSSPRTHHMAHRGRHWRVQSSLTPSLEEAANFSVEMDDYGATVGEALVKKKAPPCPSSSLAPFWRRPWSLIPPSYLLQAHAGWLVLCTGAFDQSTNAHFQSAHLRICVFHLLIPLNLQLCTGCSVGVGFTQGQRRWSDPWAVPPPTPSVGRGGGNPSPPQT